MKNQWLVIAYEEWEDQENKHVFTSKNKKGVVGIMKLIMDNFDPVHIDIIQEGTQ